MSFVAQLHMNQVDTLTSVPRTQQRCWQSLAQSRSGAPWQLVGHDVTVRIASAATTTVTSGWAVLHHVKGLHYRAYRLPCVLQSVLSRLTVRSQPVRDSTHSSWSIQTSKKRTGSRFLIFLQPLTARIAPRLSDQTNIWPSTPGPQHRISISSSAEQQPRGARVLFLGTQRHWEPWRAAAKTDQSLTFGGQHRHLRA